VWQWECYDDPAGINSIKVDDPTKYTLQLSPDGMYQVNADCDRSGKYTLDGLRLTLEPGLTTPRRRRR
jgi:heat shock protein HslJ